jgi:transposase
MSKSLSLDLRERVVAAVAGGMSRRAAAERFGVSAASAVRWCQSARHSGSIAPKPLGGDRRSGRVERQAALILSLVDGKSDITLAEIQAELARLGQSFGLSTLCRFFQRHRYTRKKRQLMRPSRTVPIS